MITAPPLARMAGRAAWMVRTGPQKLVSITARAFSRSVVSTDPKQSMPALLTRMSMAPWRASTSPMALVTEVVSFTSRASNSMSRPSAAALATNVSALARSRMVA